MSYSFGIIFLGFVYMIETNGNKINFFDSGESILKDILLVTGWFFVWESVENFVSDRRILRIDKINNRQMLNAELIFEKELVSVE